VGLEAERLRPLAVFLALGVGPLALLHHVGAELRRLAYEPLRPLVVGARDGQGLTLPQHSIPGGAPPEHHRGGGLAPHGLRQVAAQPQAGAAATAFDDPGVLTGAEMFAYAPALKDAHRALSEARAALHAARRRHRGEG
jgi:hypothetical protein